MPGADARGASGLAAPVAEACGGFFFRSLSPEERPSLAREKVLIIHDAARRAERRFGSVVPTPSLPEVSRVDKTPFSRLRDSADALTPMVSIERPIPAVFHRAYTVTGPLAKDVVRRIVRSHINEVRYCYNQGVARNPKLRGTIVVDFTIAVTGKVSASTVRSSTLTDPKVDTCIVESTRRWVFPKPSGGTVDVSYEFELAVVNQSPSTAD